MGQVRGNVHNGHVRRREGWTHELATEEPRSDFDILLTRFKSPLIHILLVAFVVTFLIDEYTAAAVIAAVLVIATIRREHRRVALRHRGRRS